MLLVCKIPADDLLLLGLRAPVFAGIHCEAEFEPGACYHGKLESRPLLGIGRIPDIQDIDHALRLIRRSLILWLIVICAGEWLIERISTS